MRRKDLIRAIELMGSYNFEHKRKIIRVKKDDSRGDAATQSEEKTVKILLAPLRRCVSARKRVKFSCFKTVGRGTACGIGRGADWADGASRYPKSVGQDFLFRNILKLLTINSIMTIKDNNHG